MLEDLPERVHTGRIHEWHVTEANDRCFNLQLRPLDAKGANSTITSNRNIEGTIPASGLVAPFRTLVAVRAMAPVEAKPPKSGVRTLAAPCPMSSWSRVVILAGRYSTF
jgi:hypothetical protein